jgi:hypothetical protein
MRHLAVSVMVALASIHTNVGAQEKYALTWTFEPAKA